MLVCFFGFFLYMFLKKKMPTGQTTVNSAGPFTFSRGPFYYQKTWNTGKTQNTRRKWARPYVTVSLDT